MNRTILIIGAVAVALSCVSTTASALWLFAVVATRTLFETRRRSASRFVNGRVLSVVFLHPDLGIGGAERLIVDAAVGLQQMHKCGVRIVTNFHDPKRCFRETADGTLAVDVVGSWFPRHVGGKGHVLCATVRMCIAAAWTAATTQCDIFIVDQVAAAMPVLRLLTTAPVFFYCHFPDQLCDPSRMQSLVLGATAGNLTKPARSSPLRRAYRGVFDWIESVTMRCASRMCCNSAFTLRTTLATFPQLQDCRLLLSPPACTADEEQRFILYPPINIADLLTPKASTPESEALKARLTRPGTLPVVSINRFERKKNLRLAVEAFALAMEDAPPEVRKGLTLVMAGGYDPRLKENVEYYEELKALCTAKGIPTEQTVFLRSFSDAEKQVLLTHAACVLYTPSGEHFGIVPVEAMAFERCVIGVNNGGPCESITTSDVFGLLREPEPRAFADAMKLVLFAPGASDARTAIGRAAVRRCRDLFSLEAFSKKLHAHLVDAVEGKP